MKSMKRMFYLVITASALILWSNNIAFGLSEPGLVPVTDCVCPGHIATFRCTVQGGLLTVWEGTAFNCPNNEIILTNINFGTPTAFGICNNGDIFGQGLSVDGDCYTSELNVTFQAMLENRTVVCSVDNGTAASVVGHDVLRASTTPFPSPTNITLIRVNSTELVFSWNQTQRCPSINYNIVADNCGNCPNTTRSTSVSCSNFTTSEMVNVCSFIVQTVTCGDGPSPLVGTFSSPISVNLTVPGVQLLLSVPHYDLNNGLRGITVTFLTAAPFVIYNKINGSIESYTVTYSDADSGSLCYSQIILANDSNCKVGVCTNEFNVSSSMCPQSTDVVVTVFLTTNLGEGPKSPLVTEEYENNYVTVEVVAQTTSINCTFPGTIAGGDYSCNATIIYGPNCQNQTNLIGEIIGDNLISIGLRGFLEQTRAPRYCGFVASVTAGEKCLMVEGNLGFVSLFNDQNNSGAIAAAAIVPAGAILLITIIVIISVITIKRRSKSVHIEQMDRKGLASQQNIPKMYTVTDACNMIEFAKEKYPSYKPDTRIGYYELQPGSTEYILSTTNVVLINEENTEMCTGAEARTLVGFCNSNTSTRRQPIKMPDAPWTCAFIQCTSRIRKLPEGTRFMFYPERDNDKSVSHARGKLRDDIEHLKLLEEKYFKLRDVHEECLLCKFIVEEKITSRGNLGLGYCFYEFTKPEHIPYSKQVILMDKDNTIYYGAAARREIGLYPNYDEAVEREPPCFPESSRWKKAFIQSRSNIRKLQPNTQFLYCTVASTEVEEVFDPFELFDVDQVDEDSRRVMKFVQGKIHDYNPRDGYGYYQFSKTGYVSPDRNVIALKKNKKLYMGLGVRHLIGAAEDYDGKTELDPPNLADSEEWDCFFIQSKSFSRVLPSNTRFLYCEYDNILI